MSRIPNTQWPIAGVWTYDDQTEANKEGWYITVTVPGFIKATYKGPYALPSWEKEQYGHDLAHDYVTRRAAEGSALHQRAFACITALKLQGHPYS